MAVDLITDAGPCLLLAFDTITHTHVNRLEAATSRLEDIAVAQQSQQLVANVAGPSAGPPPAGAATSAPTDASSAPSQDDAKVQGFKELVDGPLKKYSDLSNEIGGLVAEQVRGLRCSSPDTRRTMITWS
jgi:adenylyl cyclase-associated protein